MEAKIMKLDTLLQENTVLQCPIIQRSYTWGEKEVKQYVDDIILQGKNKKSSEYFIGTMIIREENLTSIDGISYSILYEGQQRVTTTDLIYYGLYLFYKKNPELMPNGLDTPEILLKYVYNNLNSTKVKLKLNNNDQADFQNILDGKNTKSHMNDMFKLIQKRINKTNHIYVLLGLRKLKVILTKLNGEDNADMIFDTVNTRGKPLEFIDKLRNLCLLNLPPKIQEEIYYKKWVPFYNQVKENNFDNHLSSWVRGMAIYLGNPRPANMTKNYMIKYLRSFSSEEAMTLLNEYNNVLITMKKESAYSKQCSQLFSLNLIPGVVGIYSLVKSCQMGQLNNSQCKSLVNGVLSFCIRAWINGKITKLHYWMYTVVRYTKQNPLNLYETVRTFLYEESAKHGLLSEDVKTKVENKEWNNTQGKQMLILLESSLNSRSGDLKDMTVEHIMPMVYEMKSSKTNVKQLLGNLTLLPSTENSQLSNKDFLSKKQMEGGFDCSTLVIDEYIKQQNNWTEYEIKERTSLLAQKICDLWPEDVACV